MNEAETLKMMVEEIVMASFDIADLLGCNPDLDIAKASHSAIKQLLAIKAYELVSRSDTLTIPLPDFVEACR